MEHEIHEAVLKRQRDAQKSGDRFEIFVKNFLNKKLKHRDIAILRGKEIKCDSPLWEKLAIPVEKLGSKQKIWGDVDLVAIRGKFPNIKIIAIISCKVSLHGRFSETLFYALIWKKKLHHVKVIFVTPDKGRQQKGPWKSEWGSEEKPTKDRLLGSHFLDGIYVYNKRTKLGGMIKPLEDSPKDLIKWCIS